MTRTILIIATLVAALFVLPSCMFIVHQSEVGIVTRFGKPRAELAEPGLHFKLPWTVDRALLVLASVAYFGGVHAPTVAINIPLNNQVQSLELANMDAAELRAARTAFETRWNRWNTIRTAFALASVTFMVILLVRG